MEPNLLARAQGPTTMKDQANPPKVSVCVITYNQEAYIRQCLQSLVDQKANFNFEVIVADDCSTDNTPAVVREFIERHPRIVRALFQERNTGGSRNNLEVHAAATGEYVAHVDGDDYALPGKLQAQADLLDREPGCNAVWHRVDLFDDAGGFCSGKTADLSIFRNGVVSFADAARLGFIGVHSSLMYRRSARNPIDLDKKVLDIYITWMLLSRGTGFFIDTVLGRYRVGASGSLSVASARKIRLLAIEHAEHFLREFPEQRKNFFLWAVCSGIVDLKNGRKTTLDFLRLAIRTFSLVSPGEIVSNIFDYRRMQVRWQERDNAAAKAK